MMQVFMCIGVLILALAIVLVFLLMPKGGDDPRPEKVEPMGSRPPKGSARDYPIAGLADHDIEQLDKLSAYELQHNLETAHRLYTQTGRDRAAWPEIRITTPERPALPEPGVSIETLPHREEARKVR